MNTTAPILASPLPRPSAPARRSASSCFLVSILLVIFCLAALVAGIHLRRWTWEATASIHFTSDIERGYSWGRQATLDGYPNLYERMAREQNAASPLWLDYAPLRLLVMEEWARWAHTHFPDTAGWQPDYDFNRPILLFNTLMELLAALGAFLLVRRYGFCAWGHPNMRALFAALLVWFNPAIILSAHGWPTWDAWIIPFYLFAILWAGEERWFASGVLLAIGAMFKGQQFFVAPIFIIWPLVLGKPAAALRWLTGLTLGIALLAFIWLISYLPPGEITGPRRIDWPAIAWITGATLATIAAAWLMHRQSSTNAAGPHRAAGKTLTRIIAALILTTALTWPFWFAPITAAFAIALVLAATLYVAALHIPRSQTSTLVAATLAATLLLCMPFFHGSHAWIDCAFLYGTNHWTWMTTGLSSNLPALLQLRWGWGNGPAGANEALFQIPAGLILGYPHAPLAVSLRVALFALYGLTLIASAIGIALHHRRRDPRFLVAITAPWLMFFCFPAQIHERYLLFAAGIGAVMAGQSLGMALVAFFLSGVAFLMTLHVMVVRGLDSLAQQIGPASADHLKSALDATHPDIAWAVLFSAALVLYLTLVPSPAAQCALPKPRTYA